MSHPKRFICTRVLGMFEMQDAENGDWIYHTDYAALAAEVEVLRRKVEWLQKADRLVIWNGTEWQVRHQLDGETRVAK